MTNNHNRVSLGNLYPEAPIMGRFVSPWDTSGWYSVYAKESESLIEQIRMIARDALYHCLNKGITDWTQLKYKVKDDLSKFIYSQTKRKPMILPIIMDI